MAEQEKTYTETMEIQSRLGNKNLITRILNDASSGYDLPAHHWKGLMSASINFTRTVTEVYADDVVQKVVFGAWSGEGSIQLLGVKNEDYERLMNVVYFQGKGVRF
jgi:hypothetical protein